MDDGTEISSNGTNLISNDEVEGENSEEIEIQDIRHDFVENEGNEFVLSENNNENED